MPLVRGFPEVLLGRMGRLQSLGSLGPRNVFHSRTPSIARRDLLVRTGLLYPLRFAESSRPLLLLVVRESASSAFRRCAATGLSDASAARSVGATGPCSARVERTDVDHPGPCPRDSHRPTGRGRLCLRGPVVAAGPHEQWAASHRPLCRALLRRDELDAHADECAVGLVHVRDAADAHQPGRPDGPRSDGIRSPQLFLGPRGVLPSAAE